MQRSHHRSRAERGQIAPLVALCLAVILAMVGLAIDLGSSFIASSNLSKAVDAAALEAARHTTLGDTGMKDLVQQIASANDVKGLVGASYDTVITHPDADTTQVEVTGSASAPTFFLKAANRANFAVSRSGTATRFPLDMSLVLDTSYSLHTNGGWGPLQDAAKQFLAEFNDSTDQVGLVTFYTIAQQQMALQKDFTTTGSNIIDALSPISDTNIGDGLRYGKRQLDGATRANSVKILVLFTDGQADAVTSVFKYASGAGSITMCHDGGGDPPVYTTLPGVALDQVYTHAAQGDHVGPCPPDPDGQATYDGCSASGTPFWYEGVLAAYGSSTLWGTFRLSDGQQIFNWTSACAPSSLAANMPRYRTSPVVPVELPGNLQVNADNVRQLAAASALYWANAVRAAGYTLYVVALGNSNPSDPYDSPDLPFLRQIANEGGVSSSSQPKGKMYYAPTPSDLKTAFTRLADRVLTRLTQ